MQQLWLVFIHGFRGSDKSFQDFPTQLERRITPLVAPTQVQVLVYPTYKTSGSLTTAVQDLSTWLASKTNGALESQDGVILLGHSMGGIVAAETVFQHHQGLACGSRIIGLLAFDTPYYSINPAFVSSHTARGVQQLGQWVSAATNARNNVTRSATAATSSTSRWGLLAGATAAVAAVGATAYLGRDTIASATSGIYDQLAFVGALTDTRACSARVQRLTNLTQFMFRCFYVQLDAASESSATTSSTAASRTFIALPPAETAHVFLPVPITASSEVDAHTSMFHPTKNRSYDTLLSDSTVLVLDMASRFQRTLS